MSPSTPHTSGSLPAVHNFFLSILEALLTSALTIGYISSITLFLAYNTLYKAVEMSAMYALQYVGMFKIPLVISGVAVVGSGIAAVGSGIARVMTGMGFGVASVGWVVGGGIAKVMALPENLICAFMFRRQCPQLSRHLEVLKRSEEAEKRPLLEKKERHEMV